MYVLLALLAKDTSEVPSPLPLLLREARPAALRACLLARLLTLYAASQYHDEVERLSSSSGTSDNSAGVMLLEIVDRLHAPM